ncbi:MAG TPA: FAD-dependent oxidoreductase [Candidatus Limnocylindrales bacterium]|nr:FAD-dependent oxidoreductase [Candidatus Limnocylindrales bacterium]
MVDSARVVVVGGGITGCSIAYHLALAGWTDVLLVEKAGLTAGSTSQAAGLVTAFNPSSTMLAWRKYSIELYGKLGAFSPVGSVRLASSPEQLKELERTASRARGVGLDVGVISADEARRLMPAISPDDLFGAVYLPGDGYLDPHTATFAVAAAARTLGVRVRQNTRVTGFELGPHREIGRVLVDNGDPIDTEIVVNAAGMWAPRIAEMLDLFVPSTPVDHQHVALKAVPGHELPDDMPCFRDPDNLVYGKAEHGGMLFGGYENEPRSRWEEGVPWDHAAQSLPPDWERFQPLMEGAIRRFPFLAEAEAVRLVCHPDAMTPDANPLIGPMPGVRGFWMAAGLSLNGFGGGGGIGRSIAGWITTGDPGVDIAPYRAWRFADVYRDREFAAALARETYADYYRLRFPYDAEVAGRPKRLSALHQRLGKAGAVFGTKAGWERADYHRPGEHWTRNGRIDRAHGWSRPDWFERVGEEHRAVRERVGIIDLSSFGKIAVAGPGALALLQRVCANDVDKPIGSTVYTQFLDERGGIVADVTVSRDYIDRFRVTTGSGFLAADLGWLVARAADEPAIERVTIDDRTDAWSVIGLWGPQARDVLAGITSDAVDDAALPLRQVRSIRVGGFGVTATRLSYAGELGWELMVEPANAVEVWDGLMAAGKPRGIEPIGYRALESLRLEKGFRYFGAELTPRETPFEAGLGRFVKVDKPGGFVGRDALVARQAAEPDGPARRLRTLAMGGDDWIPVYGGEAVRVGGEVIGRLRSAAFGYTVGRTIGTAYLPAGMPEDATIEIDVFADRIPATVTADVLVDPPGMRMRG